MSRVTTLIPPPVACAALSSPLARGRAGNGAPPSRPVQAESSGASTTKRPHRLTPAAGSLSAGLPRLFSLIAYVDITPYFIAFLPIVKSRFSSLCQISRKMHRYRHNFSEQADLAGVRHSGERAKGLELLDVGLTQLAARVGKLLHGDKGLAFPLFHRVQRRRLAQTV